MNEGKDLLAVLWSGADVLREKIDANEYKTYLLGLVLFSYFVIEISLVILGNRRTGLL